LSKNEVKNLKRRKRLRRKFFYTFFTVIIVFCVMASLVALAGLISSAGDVLQVLAKTGAIDRTKEVVGPGFRVEFYEPEATKPIPETTQNYSSYQGSAAPLVPIIDHSVTTVIVHQTVEPVAEPVYIYSYTHSKPCANADSRSG
jgi:hypothetical protein